MSGFGEGSFSVLSTQIIRHALWVRGGNMIAKRGCWYLEDFFSAGRTHWCSRLKGHSTDTSMHSYTNKTNVDWLHSIRFYWDRAVSKISPRITQNQVCFVMCIEFAFKWCWTLVGPWATFWSWPEFKYCISSSLLYHSNLTLPACSKASVCFWKHFFKRVNTEWNRFIYFLT